VVLILAWVLTGVPWRHWLAQSLRPMNPRLAYRDKYVSPGRPLGDEYKVALLGRQVAEAIIFLEALGCTCGGLTGADAMMLTPSHCQLADFENGPLGISTSKRSVDHGASGVGISWQPVMPHEDLAASVQSFGRIFFETALCRPLSAADLARPAAALPATGISRPLQLMLQAVRPLSRTGCRGESTEPPSHPFVHGFPCQLPRSLPPSLLTRRATPGAAAGGIRRRAAGRPELAEALAGSPARRVL
jgi:hypothetical protein